MILKLLFLCFLTIAAVFQGHDFFSKKCVLKIRYVVEGLHVPLSLAKKSKQEKLDSSRTNYDGRFVLHTKLSHSYDNNKESGLENNYSHPIPNPGRKLAEESRCSSSVHNRTFCGIKFKVYATIFAISIFSFWGLATPVIASTLPTENGMTIDLSALKESLRPATESQPAIPFPTNEALLDASQMKTSSSAIGKSNPISRQNNLPDTDKPYTIQALIALGNRPGNERPYNGADVLVLQVWSDLPSSITESSKKLLGGAKVPIGALFGGFPVRISLGPQNAMAGMENQWKSNLSSRSVWVTASICGNRGDDGSDFASIDEKKSSKTTNFCPTDYSSTVLKGTGFSKWIDLSTDGETVGVGIRAPTSIVLDIPRN